ncbi:NAD(P)/FAD-dependent oxidoreductase [uncultured Anaerococcus sp.]|uniref:NAD(P)/FAD-dependent oxidoreductase n=1 Tax=uncultured Anaerococcus sp. TaxID=293428 RepID=UPI0028898935|nr:NAD(P)/FAD-dependent oxidoreductase [uncultured Anaerococcus sp.]
MKKIGIIGAGPSGIMAAISAKNENNQVTLFEGNEIIGKKLLMTGGGRCNITNAAYFDEFLDNVMTNSKFIYSAFTNFDNYGLIDFLNHNGLTTKIEDDGRVFPESEKSRDVIDFFEKKLKEKSIILKTGDRITKAYKDKYFYLTDQKNNTYIFDYLIVATGGRSYPRTGSDGYGYKLARKFGHEIIDPKPVLVPIFIKDRLKLKAQSFKNIRITIETTKGNFSIDGDLMINQNFLTGPCALKASSFMRDKTIKALSIDFFPNLTYNELEKEILVLINENAKKSIENSLKSILNNALIEEILRLTKIDINKKASELTKLERKLIIEKIKNFNLMFDKLGSFESAVVTRGGVDVKTINPKNMESKLVDRLFFVGEILDIDSLTGGFNLQVYFSTAYAAGTFIKENT